MMARASPASAGRERIVPPRLRPLLLQAPTVLAKHSFEHRDIADDDRVLGRLPRRRRHALAWTLDLLPELRPALFAVFARDDELRIGKLERVAPGAMMRAYSLQRG